jgi:hypothetical protein
MTDEMTDDMADDMADGASGPAPERQAGRLLTSRKYPVYYYPVLKCGNTFVKNLLYVLDNDQPHPDPLKIHGEGGKVLAYAGDTPLEEINASGRAFAVVREPVSRFASFYFDKVYVPEPGPFQNMRAILKGQYGLDLSDGADRDRHRANAHRLLDFIGDVRSGKCKARRNPHFLPQASRYQVVRDVDFTLIPLDKLNPMLIALFKDLIPDLEAQMDRVTERNKSNRRGYADDIFDGELTDRIRKDYVRDMRMYKRAQRDWERVSASAG